MHTLRSALFATVSSVISGVLDMTDFDGWAAQEGLCHGVTGTTTTTLTIQQRLYGTSAPAASSDVDVTIDCDQANEDFKQLNILSAADDSGCAVAARPRGGDGRFGGAVGMIGMVGAWLVRRRRRHG